ncbi:MAG: hypothetical protein ACR2JM_08510 [Mycobacterium sp.]
MFVSARSYLTAGVAAVGAAAIAAAPIQPIQHNLTVAPAQASALAVELAAAIDPITPWVDTITAAGDNISSLITAWAARPLPIVQQVIENGVTYLGELPDIGLIFNQVITNVQNAVGAGIEANPASLNTEHGFVYPVLKQLLPDYATLIDFTTSPVSGAILGLVGPIVAPFLALRDSVQSIFAALQVSDIAGAINDLINIPAAMTNAFLNGGPSINLTSVLAPLIPAGTAVLNDAELVLGGLLSPGASLFNALSVDAAVCTVSCNPPFTIPIDIPAGPPAGIIGSLIAWTQVIADAIVVTPPAATAARTPAAAVEAAAPAAEIEAAAPAAEVAAADIAVADNAAADDPAPQAAPRATHRAARGGGAGDGGSDAGASTPKRASARHAG